MERVRSLNRYQKLLLLLMILLPLIFSVIYPMTIARVGYSYRGAILVPTQENGQTRYCGKIRGEDACFTVSGQGTVTFQYGEKTYEPFTVKEDRSAVPYGHESNPNVVGLEVREGEKILFRGGLLVENGAYYWYDNEDDTSAGVPGVDISSNGTVYNENGETVDKMKPSVKVLYELTHNPELTHKGVAAGWFFGTLACLLNVLGLLFAQELFWLRMSFRVSNPECLEPSGWEIACRYIGWTGMAIVALVAFFMGLR